MKNSLLICWIMALLPFFSFGQKTIEKTPPPPPVVEQPPVIEQPPVSKLIDGQEVFINVDEPPYFPGCESEKDAKSKKRCADEKMLTHIYSQLKYPAIAREHKVEGMVIVRFVVQEDGTISNAGILRDIGAGCGAEAIRIVGTMPAWTPGRKDGKAVPVEFKLPVKFKIEEEKPAAKIEVEAAPPPPPPPPPPKESVNEVFMVVEDWPRMEGCEDVTDKEKKKECTNEKLNAFLDEHVIYPKLALDNSIQGKVAVRFVVEKDGSITGAEVVRDIGANCGKEVLRVVNEMPAWLPGKQRNRPVRVQYTVTYEYSIEKWKKLQKGKKRKGKG